MEQYDAGLLEENLRRFGSLIQGRNAYDFLESLVDRFSGHLGNFLITQQMMQDHGDRCPECDAGDEFPDQIQ